MPLRWVDLHHRSFRNNLTRIMLRFRPIAPKPAGGGEPDQEKVNLLQVGRRTKRKYVRVRGRTTRKTSTTSSKQCVVSVKRMDKTSPTDNSEVDDAPAPVKEVVTLQLLPERSDDEKVVDRELKESTDDIISCSKVKSSSAAAAVVQTWIVVESVTEKYSSSDDDELVLGFWDVERMKDLDRETCPGFVTDGTNRVIWVNEAYRRMVGGLAVVLVVQGELPQGGCFACRVRIVEQQGQKWKNRIVPCDVWRMGSTGFVWKLDLNTALTLSLSL